MNAAWDAWIARAESIDILAVAERCQAKLRRAGPHFVGACPAGCASTDGFVVTPRERLFLCRPSGSSGNAIVMVRHALGFGFAEALEFITGQTRPDRSHDEAPEMKRMTEIERGRLGEEGRRRAAAVEARELSARDRSLALIAEILAAARPIPGTIVEAYLRARGLRPSASVIEGLRYVADLEYWGYASAQAEIRTMLARLPAMIAPIVDAKGVVIGLHRTYLDRLTPIKFEPPDQKRDRAKKMLGEARGGMIRLGPIGERLAIGEGIETTLGWHGLGMGPDDVTIAAAGSLGNLAGAWTATLAHPTRRGADGKPTRMPNGEPDMARPGVILPPRVREVILLGDGDSEPLATRGAILTGARRFRREGRQAAVHFAPDGEDWSDVAKRAAAQHEAPGQRRGVMELVAA